MTASSVGSAYAAVLRDLVERRRFGMDLGLDRMRAVLARLGDPQRAYRVVHVGGTNGKGSTVAFAVALLRAAGLRVGAYTSPHLSRLTERIVVDGREIERAEVVRLHEAVRAAAGRDAIELTFFEAVTAMGLLAFRDAQVDVAVVEVGLGGRLDATNVVDPEVAVVTGIALEHQEVLGSTLGAIAREKAGIFKQGRPAVLAAVDEEARAVLRAEAAARGARPVRELGRDIAPLDVALGLAGPHQQQNAALAVAAVSFVAPGLSTATRDAALAAARWPGRIETVATEPTVIVDCAHNPDGARALAQALEGRRAILLAGMAADKDAAGVLSALRPLAAEVVATEPRSARALAATALAEVARAVLAVPVRTEPDVLAALAWARARATATGLPVLACGSIFLAGPLREHLLGETPDPATVSDPTPRPAS